MTTPGAVESRFDFTDQLDTSPTRCFALTFNFLGFGACDKPEGANYGFKQQQNVLEAVVGLNPYAFFMFRSRIWKAGQTFKFALLAQPRTR
jgi:hypothetical protein